MILTLRPSEPPAVMHVTHHKAGSQWILAILNGCVADRVVQPEAGVAHFLGQSLEEGRVYPTLYITREQFEAAELPRRWRRFVIIRDLRDTLVSQYFSLMLSHTTEGYPQVQEMRSKLASMTKEDGLKRLASHGVARSANLQRSWLDGGEELIRYEDLLAHDTELLERVLIDRCELPVSRERLRRAIEGNRFERLSGGRKPGEEDPRSHWRKGVAGDWRNHLTEPVKAACKELWGDVLIATGYERDDDW